jgi:hypothetical protein
MRFAQSAAILVLGMLLGIALSGGLPPIGAQGAANQQRLSLISGNATAVGMAGLSSLNFVKDSKTNGCWLMASTAQSVSLTAAPDEACR